jgi:hypothetical protein
LGRLAILAWAIGIAYIGYLLVVGQGSVALAALEAGRISEAVMQGLFVTLVFISTAAACVLFLVVGVARE